VLCHRNIGFICLAIGHYHVVGRFRLEAARLLCFSLTRTKAPS
jgi:hypothetical protein